MTPETRQRLLIRSTLVAGMLLAGLGLFAVIKAKSKGRGAGQAPALARQGLRVKVVDRSGKVVEGASAFVRTAQGATPTQARWSPKDGVLMLPRRGEAHDLRVTARGYKLQDVADVGDDRTVTLERGLRLRVRVRDVPETGLPKRVRVMLRIRPLDVDENDPDGLSVATIVDLMDNLGGSGPQDLARGDFGYPVSLAQAKRGILVPRAGRYHVRWGLIHIKAGSNMKGSTWFTLGDRCGRDVEVGASGAAVELVMTLDDLQATIDGLTRRMQAAAR